MASEGERLAALEAAERELRASEERLRMAAEVAEFGSYDLDLPTGAMVWSQQMYRIMGVAEGGPIDFDSTVELIHPEDKDRVLGIFDAAIDPRGPGRAAAEFRIVRPDGEVRWLMSRARTFFEGAGEARRALRYVGAVQDISERKAAEARLKESEARLRVVLSAGSLGDWSWDSESDVVTLSQEAAALFGLPAGRTVTWTEMRSVLDPEDAPRAVAAVEAAMAEGADYKIDYRINRPNDGTIWAKAVGRATYDSDGRATGMVGAVQDITASREAEEALRQESRTLETLNRTGAAIAAELDLETLVQIVTDAGVELTGSKFGAFFYNVISEAGESLLLYTLSGARRRGRRSLRPIGLPPAPQGSFVPEGAPPAFPCGDRSCRIADRP